MHVKRITALVGGLALALPLAACGDDNGSGGGSFCDQLETFMDEYDGLDDAAITEDPAIMDDMGAEIKNLAEAAPDDIKADWETMAAAFDTVAELRNESPNLEDLQDTEALDEQMSILEDMATAGENINAHAEEECGIALDGG